ncbi:sugar ABC transporter permease [Klebsiella pneumoniae]|uniref:ABC transporter permease n=1 Tax=Klebsiella pneumoniae TaxID=573 RepID=UPI000D0B4CAD|nr:ABC transporter permease [Klebsiella pneumoniae]PSD05232.1 sugar ABC transporter permease [Klebsiella pneumoniae]
MMPRSLSQTGPEKRRFTWPKGTPQIIALLLVLLVDSLVAPHFYQVVLQDGRLFGSPIDILNRAAPVAVATLILMVAGRGVAQLITAGQIVTFDSPALAWLGSGSFLLFPTPVIVAAATLLLFWLFTRKTALGMFIEAVGINIRAAKNAGVNTRIVVMLAYVLSGVCAAIAGIIVAADIRGADANNAGLWLELDAILAVVIGGASLMGGRFNLLLSVVGALIIQGMNTGILLSGFPPELNQVVKAVVVLCVLIVQSPRFIGLLKGVRGHDKT